MYIPLLKMYNFQYDYQVDLQSENALGNRRFF